LLAKDDLIAQVWPGVFVTDNSLTRAVSELRRSLGDVAEEPQYIQTVARRGYRFVAPVRVGTRSTPAVSIAPKTLTAHKVEADARQQLEAFSADALPDAVATLERQRDAHPDRSARAWPWRTRISSSTKRRARLRVTALIAEKG
jgi:DNA-binding winged helix-turn-helix (wHTH) protein